MKLKSLTNSENWERRLATRRKKLGQVFRHRCESKPIFVLGKQRSGTSMIMRTFHRHPNTLVYDEHGDSIAYVDYRLRSFATVRGLLEQSRFPTVCFKAICDSHLIRELRDAFPDAHFIWAYRDYADVANSALRKFETPNRAIRLVCTNQPGGGWFQEGVSPTVGEVLRSVYRSSRLSEFDLSCLVWWARNRILLESGLAGALNVTPIKYEALVSAPSAMLGWLYYRSGLDYRERVARNISPRSIRRHPTPEITPVVQELCDETQDELDAAFRAANPPRTQGSVSAKPEEARRSAVL